MPIDEKAFKPILDKHVDLWHKTFARDAIEMYEANKAKDQPEERGAENASAAQEIGAARTDHPVSGREGRRPDESRRHLGMKVAANTPDTATLTPELQAGSDQPVGLSVADIESAIRNARPERIVLRREIQQRSGEPPELLHEQIEYRVTAAQQASAVFEAIRPHLRQAEQESAQSDDCRDAFNHWALSNLPLDSREQYYLIESINPFDMWRAAWESRPERESQTQENLARKEKADD